MLGDIRSLTREIVPTCQRLTLTSGDPGERGGGGVKKFKGEGQLCCECFQMCCCTTGEYCSPG
jgi:hypothetical protein